MQTWKVLTIICNTNQLKKKNKFNIQTPLYTECLEGKKISLRVKNLSFFLEYRECAKDYPL